MFSSIAVMPIVRCDENAIRSGYVEVIMGFIQLRNLANHEIREDVEEYVSNFVIEAPRKAGGRRKMTDEEREERDRIRSEAKAKKRAETAAKRAKVKAERDADKALWMTPVSG